MLPPRAAGTTLPRLPRCSRAPRAPRPAPRRAGSRLLIAAPVWGHGAAPAGWTRSLEALRPLARTFRFGMGASKGENPGQEGNCRGSLPEAPGSAALRVRRRMLQWRGERPSAARSGLHPSCGCSGWQGTAPGGQGCIWVPVALCPAASQPLSAAVHAQMRRARSPVARGYRNGVSTLGFVSHFLFSGERLYDKLPGSRASRGLI